MARFLGAHEIYRELVEDDQSNWEMALLAFAIIEEQRIEWMNHCLENQGAYPDNDAIQAWYGNVTAGTLLRARDTAASRLNSLYGEMLSTALDEEREKIQQSMIIHEINEVKAEGKKILPQMMISVFGGLISTVLFTAILVLVYLFVANDVSPQKIFSGQQAQTTEAMTDEEQ